MKASRPMKEELAKSDSSSEEGEGGVYLAESRSPCLRVWTESTNEAVSRSKWSPRKWEKKERLSSSQLRMGKKLATGSLRSSGFLQIGFKLEI